MQRRTTSFFFALAQSRRAHEFQFPSRSSGFVVARFYHQPAPSSATSSVSSFLLCTLRISSRRRPTMSSRFSFFFGYLGVFVLSSISGLCLLRAYGESERDELHRDALAKFAGITEEHEDSVTRELHEAGITRGSAVRSWKNHERAAGPVAGAPRRQWSRPRDRVVWPRFATSWLVVQECFRQHRGRTQKSFFPHSPAGDGLARGARDAAGGRKNQGTNFRTA